MTKNGMYNISCSCIQDYKGETDQSLKVKFQEHQKAVICGDTLKS